MMVYMPVMYMAIMGPYMAPNGGLPCAPHNSHVDPVTAMTEPRPTPFRNRTALHEGLTMA